MSGTQPWCHGDMHCTQNLAEARKLKTCTVVGRSPSAEADQFQTRLLVRGRDVQGGGLDLEVNYCWLRALRLAAPAPNRKQRHATR